jgi:uncharacterized protein (TIGR03790 family)
LRSLISVLAVAALLAAHSVGAAALTPSQLGLVVNDDEPNSVAIAELYRVAHDIPAANIAHVRIPNRPRKISAATFEELKKEIDRQLPANVRATLMVWTAPYAVECNSITSAYTNGFDAEQCVKTCGPGKESPFFDKKPTAPLALPANAGRISMLLPTDSVEQAKALIGRGTVRYMTPPPSTAYYLVTSEVARNSRAQFFPPNGKLTAKNLTVRQLKQDALDSAQDIIIYQTGMARVAKLDTLRFLPGALADHLTSTGGDLLSDYQMSSLRWLEAGATASYGTVTEPCNYWQKFPNPVLLLKNYVSGATAIEAYWSSVAWPAQGVFIGDPLAAPYKQGN